MRITNTGVAAGTPNARAAGKQGCDAASHVSPLALTPSVHVAGATCTGERFQDLPPVKRRRLIVWAVVRSLLNAAVLVVLYYVLPLDRPRDSDTAVRLLIGLLVFAGVTVWGVRTIAGSRYPGGAAGGSFTNVIITGSG